MRKHYEGQNGVSSLREDRPNSQANDGEDDAENGGKDVCNAEGKAQNHAQHTGPARKAVRNMTQATKRDSEMSEASHEEQAPIRHLATASVLQRCSKLGKALGGNI